MKNGSSTTVQGFEAVTFDALFVVNGGDATLSVVNTETQEVAGTIALQNASFPHHISLNANRSMIALAVPGMDLSGGHGDHGAHVMPGLVMLLDATTGMTHAARELPAMNHNAAFGPIAGELWTTQMATPGQVLVLDADTLADKAAVDVGQGPAEITFGADGVYAFVANGASDSVTVIDAATKEVVKTIAVGKGPVGAWQGANGIAYVDNEAGKTITAIDTKTLDVLLTYKLGFTPGYAALAPDGMLWITDADNGRVVVYMADMDMKHHVIPTGQGAHAIAFSGGESGAGYVTNQGENTVSVVSLDKLAVTKTLDVGDKPNGMVWRQK